MILKIFSWDVYQPEGYDERIVSRNTFDGVKELNLSDKEATELINYIKQALDEKSHVTLRLEK